MSKKTVIAVFSDAAEADAAVRDLQSHGFSNEESRTLSRTAMGAPGGAGTAYDLKPDLEEKGVPESDATYFIQCFLDGMPLVEVSVEDYDRAENAASILVDHGAQGPIRELAATGEERTMAEKTGAERMGQPTGTEREERIPIIEEEMKVGKQTLETGRTRIYSRVVEEPFSEELRLREERTVVERGPVERPATEAELREAQAGKVVEVSGTKEEPVIKQEAQERLEEIKGTVRRTEVHAEEEEPEKEKGKDI